jgi:small subunit ribosomal protein S1
MVDESYWRALLEQGEIAPETASPADPQEIFDSLGIDAGIDPSATPSSWTHYNSSSTEDPWQLARQAFEQGGLFGLRVSGANRGGVLVEWNGLQGFVPASHLKDAPRSMDPHDRASELAGRIGDTLTVRLIEVDLEQKQLVFSERAAAMRSRPATDILHSLKPGAICRGRVTNLTTFGAFVDLGGVEGLIHISELSWERVSHPGDVLAPGQEVQVYVLGVNPAEERIALSVKRLRPDPWVDADLRYQIGQMVEGQVTNVVSFGAFVRIEEGLEGLIHITELAEGSFLHPRNVVREGDVVQVRVLNVDPVKHRMGLSLRQAYIPGGRASE